MIEEYKYEEYTKRMDICFLIIYSRSYTIVDKVRSYMEIV